MYIIPSSVDVFTKRYVSVLVLSMTLMVSVLVMWEPNFIRSIDNWLFELSEIDQRNLNNYLNIRSKQAYADLVIPHIVDKRRVAKINQHVKNDIYMWRSITAYMRMVNPFLSEDTVNQYFTYFVIVSNQFDIPIGELVAIAKIESHFNHMAVSSVGCVGLMQINPIYWTTTLIDEGIINQFNDLYDPYRNIRAGAYIYLKYFTEGVYNHHPHPTKYALAKYVGTSTEYISQNPQMLNHRYVNLWFDSIMVMNNILEQ